MLTYYWGAMMVDSNSNKPKVPSVDTERLRMQREASVSISKLKAVRVQLEDLYSVVDNFNACRETAAAIGKYHKDYSILMNQYLSLHEKYIRKLSLEDWEQLRIDAILAANYSLIAEASSEPKN
jgi:hypothetical protein